MTMMVRDEADIIEAMIRFHLDQGVDMIIVTDNGSVDGTAEILGALERDGLIDLRHDPVQRKQQGEIVTKMARDAYTLHGADWVLNADADEFWSAADPRLSLRSAFEGIDTGIQSFTVPVIDMIGAPALDGSGLQRLCYQDRRSDDSLKAIGLLAHSTHDSAHIGSPDVTVAQGNHYVSLDSRGAPDVAHQIEVRHFPWRSWAQYSRKVESSGRAYESQTVLKPSPNHHGMHDYKRLQEGTLLSHYLLRHPTEAELSDGLSVGEFVADARISASVASPRLDTLIEPSIELAARRFLRTYQALEVRFAAAQQQAFEHQRLSDRLETSQMRESDLRAELELQRNRRIVRLIDRFAASSRRLNRRTRR
ncbi:glycosyltransferase family 2 protein [Cryobacterium ruanii]|uniref:Glycosyltransferase family 2 protein n=2 Tax=Cryobacterium ruanii TaxID=1259197 RepID=A0A4R9AV39_9MICO|nr:glycosyltransferase family 2 protein [Cryobacterium ruanii]